MAVQQTPVHNLPEFKKGAPFPRPNKSAEWMEQQGSLAALGGSLLVDDTPFIDDDEPIRAIPDPWAQARTFAEALIVEGHSMGPAFTAQWRGLLALLALREVRKADYSLDKRSLSLGGEHLFDRVLDRLAPRLAIGDALKLWSAPVIVYAEIGRDRAKPIAMLNPACLISPGRMSGSITIPNVAWAQNGLSDPLALEEALPPAHLVVLRKYVELLREKLGALRQTVAGDAIRQRLQTYADDIAKLLGNTPLAAKVVAEGDPDLPPLYESLWAKVKLDAIPDPSAMSQCRLALKTKGGHGALKGIILVDESLGKKGGRAARDVLVWGERTLSELLASRPTLEEVKKEAASHGFLLVTADDLFTSRAVKLWRQDAKIPGHPVVFKDMVLPLRPVVLLLAGSVPGMVDADLDSARASITLKVQLEYEGGTASHLLTRHYRTEAAEGDPLLVKEAKWAFVNAAVWPDFRSPAWSQYFARFYYLTNTPQVRPRYALSAEIIAEALKVATDGAQAVATLGGINRGDPPGADQKWYQVSDKLTDVQRDQIQFSNYPFEAITYTDVDEDRGEADAGLIWLDVDVVPNVGNAEKVVGIDFGTTNTVACFDDCDPIVFQERLLNPISFDTRTAITGQRVVYRWLWSDFIPPDARGLPTPTVAISRLRMKQQPATSVFRNVVYFPPAAENGSGDADFEQEKYDLHFGRCVFNLKWSDDEDHVVAASDFLEQMMMMTAAEAAAGGADPARIKWRFSLPDAMIGETRQNFQDHMQMLTVKYGQLDGVYSEGMAAAKYMLGGNSGAGVTPGSINAVLDIGGGTTDITLWRRDELLWRGSLRIAGQAFFTRTIRLNLDILNAIGLDDWAQLLDPKALPASPQDSKTKRSGDYYDHLAELLFSGPALGAALDQHWALKLGMKSGATLRAASIAFIGGIAYYLGLIARQLHADGVLKDEDLAIPTFALCGRGAGIFVRLHGSAQGQLDPSRNSKVTRALTLFSHAAGAPNTPQPRLFIEPQPKLEVVRGMVTEYGNIDPHMDSKQEPRSHHLPAGLGIAFASGRTVGEQESVKEPIDDWRVEKVDIENIDRFLHYLEQETGIKIDLLKGNNEGAHLMICNEVRVKIDGFRNKDGLTAMEEPPFISGLRALIGEIARPESERRLRIETQQ